MWYEIQIGLFIITCVNLIGLRKLTFCKKTRQTTKIVARFFFMSNLVNRVFPTERSLV